MRILTANLLATVVLATFISTSALAQGMYQSSQPVPPGLVGGGGTGGAGGGAESRGLVVVREVARTSPCVTREPATVRQSVAAESMTRYAAGQVPPLDPSRRVDLVSCTQPFDFRGKGNLCCI
jgi:hypothetical protein